MEKLDKAKLKQQLSPLQYDVVVNKGTERPFTGEYWDNHDAGVYLCFVCGHQLFELGPRCEEFVSADDAQVHAVVVIIPVFSGEVSLRPLVHNDVVLKWRELLLELRLVELLHGQGRTLRRLKVSARSRRAKEPISGPKSPFLHLGRVRILLPQGQPGARWILEHGEPALAHDLGLRHDDLPASLLDLLLVLVDRGDG